MTIATERPEATGEARARTRRRHSGSDPLPYDFKSPIQLSKENARILQIALDGFSRNATSNLTGVLRAVSTVSLVSIEQKAYAEYIAGLDSETYMTILETEPVTGSGVLQMPLESVMLCIDFMLGGPGSKKQPARPLSEIESNVISLLVENRLLPALRTALEPIVPMALTIRSVEFSPQFALASSTADIMIVSTFEVRFHDHSTRMTVALPFSGLNPHLSRAAEGGPLSPSERQKADAFSHGLRNAFADVPVEVRVVSRPTPMAPATLSNLAVGDVIRIAHPSAAPFEVHVNDSIYAYARTGAKGKNIAARVVAIESGSEAVTGKESA